MKELRGGRTLRIMYYRDADFVYFYIFMFKSVKIRKKKIKNKK